MILQIKTRKQICQDLDVEFQIFVHLIDVAENITDNAWYDSLHVRVTKNSLPIIHTHNTNAISQKHINSTLTQLHSAIADTHITTFNTKTAAPNQNFSKPTSE